MKKLKKTKMAFTHNRDARKWFHFAIETLIMSIVGALIAFFFEGSLSRGFMVFAILVIALLIYWIVLVVNEHRVSIVAIMKLGLADERYEDVILYGYAMSDALFTSNQNKIRVQLGELMLRAVQSIQENRYNSQKDKYLIFINNEQKTLRQIKAELLIDDTGWSRHLADDDDLSAIENILEGMKVAREAVSAILQDQSIKEDEKPIKIVPFAKIIVKAYRHLAGIYYEKQETLDKAKHIENILRIIMSNKRILEKMGVCSSRNRNLCGGIPCTKSDKRACIKHNIVDLYFQPQIMGCENSNQTALSSKCSDCEDAGMHNRRGGQQDACKGVQSLPLATLLDFDTFGDISEGFIESDVRMFAMLPKKNREKLVEEQCYAWSRNIIKKLPILLYMKSNRFVSDYEWDMMIEEALSFAELYYFGVELQNVQQFDTIINSKIIGKKELRYLRLLCETTQIGLLRQNIGVNAKNDAVDTLISMLYRTRELCRGKRTELFVRSSADLIDAYRIAYNLNYRFSMSQDCRESRNSQIERTWKQISIIRNETRKHQHRDEYLVDKAYEKAKKEYRIWKLEVKEKILFRRKSSCKEENILSLNNANVNGFSLETKLPIPSEDEIMEIKKNWDVL